MVDSDDSTTLPQVTRRRMLAGTAVAIAGWQPRMLASNCLETELSADPAIAVWLEWQVARKHTERLFRRQQRLERKLIATVGFPEATIQLSNGESLTFHSIEDIQRLLGASPQDFATRANAEAEFAAHQARWDAADKKVGYSDTLRAEREAADRAEGLLDALSKTPAVSLAGVAAKLDAVLGEGETSESEFPWPQIRSAFEDIDRMGR